MDMTTPTPPTILTRNNVKVFGNGTQPVIFAHGFGCDQTMWRFVTPAFQDDFKIVLFDYVGSGKSDSGAYDPARYDHLAGYAQDVVEICDALELKDVIFVGHSVSSVIGMLASIRAPHYFDRLILIGPSPCYLNDPPYWGGFERRDIDELLNMMEKNYLGWAGVLAPVIMKNAERPELSQELEASFCATDPAIARHFARATFLSDNRRDLEQVRVPALVMQCSEDAIAPLTVGQYVHAQLANSTLHVLNATGHCPHLSHPEETIQVIRDYLGKAQHQKSR